MTGRDLILYILANGLEDKPVFEDGKFIGFVTIGEAAEKLGVGIATVSVWISQKRLESAVVGDTIYIPVSSLESFKKGE